ncbi:hypothetical protein GGI35DRAFT_486409 [Trichoderma velutinum]
MATETVTPTTELRLASPSGIVTRKILCTPLRDALPSEIPIIDISPIFSSSLDERQAVAQQVRAAAQNMGFFYIKNHGIPADVTQDVYEAGLEFFRQDLQTKMRADSSGTKWDKGYQGPNTQRLNPSESIDMRESFSYQYDPRYDDAVGEDKLGDIPEEARQYLACEDDYPWEQTRNLPRLKESMMRHMGECLRLARALTRCFALSLGLEEGLFDEKVRYPGSSYVINYYPSIETSTELDARKSEEEDKKDLHGGLEVLNKEGQWLRAKPIEDTLVVNLGDCMQRITNDEYTSTVHRARNYSGKERVSIPLFWGFGLHETCSVVVDGEKKYEDVNCADWIMMRIRGMKQLE